MRSGSTHGVSTAAVPVWSLRADVAAEDRVGDDLRVRDLESLLAYVTAERRVCPMPGAWDKLWRLLGRRSAPPLILAAWGSPWYVKRWRLEAQIRYAAEHGMLGRVDSFLRSLPREAWKYVSEEAMRVEAERLSGHR